MQTKNRTNINLNKYYRIIYFLFLFRINNICNIIMEKRNGDLYLTLNEDFVTELKRRFDDDDDDFKNQEKLIFWACKMKNLKWENYYENYFTSNKLIFFTEKNDEMCKCIAPLSASLTNH